MERHFGVKLLSLYTDGGTEYKSLDTHLHSHGIEHLLTPPYTPQRVALVERRHCHILETTRTLLHDAPLPSNFWSFACHHAVYLINRLPTSILNHSSPYQKLFNKEPDYKSLKTFGCLCYPWLKPYSKNKLEPRSAPCVYLGFSTTHHCHQCFDPLHSRVYMSRDVQFYENNFPFKTLFSNLPTTFQTLQWDTPHSTTPPVHTLPYPPLELPPHINSSSTLSHPSVRYIRQLAYGAHDRYVSL